MEDNLMKRTQAAAKDVLAEVIRVCEENDINYFTVYGTTLGVVRHEGFIPWDDDIDLGMMREDYEKFLAIAPSKLKDKYELQEFRNTPSMLDFGFAKVRNTKTLMLEEIDMHLPFNHGIFVDIFPFDKMPEDEKKRLKLEKKIMRYRKFGILKLTTRVSYHGNKLKRMMYVLAKKSMYLMLLPFSRQCLYNKMMKCMLKYKDSPSHGYSTIGESQSYVLDSETFPLVKMKFEDIEVSVPHATDTILTRLYGDYMQLPPVEDRIGHHPIKVQFEDDNE